MKYFLSLIIVLSFFTTACSTNKKSNEPSFDAELTRFDYPYDVKEFKFTSQRQTLVMRYGDLGEVKSKKVAVLLHGKNFAGFYWEKVANELVSKGYRVIIPDQIGFGKSSKPESYQYSFPQLAHNTKLLLDHLKVNTYILVGHSMGGMLTMHLNEVDPRVEKIVLVNPIGLEAYLDYVEYKDPGFYYQNEVTKSVEQARAYQQKNYYDGKWSEAYEELLAPFKGWRNGPDWERVAWNNALTYSPIFEDEIVSKFKELKTKAVLILGVRDRTGPGRGWKKSGVKRELGRYDKLGRDIRKLNPKQIQLIELEGLGHMPQFEDYDRFAKAFYKQF